MEDKEHIFVTGLEPKPFRRVTDTGIRVNVLRSARPRELMLSFRKEALEKRKHLQLGG